MGEDFRLPCSKGRLERAGKGLRDGTLTEEQRHDLDDLLLVYMAAAEWVQDRLTAEGLSVSLPRIKQDSSLRSKLQRIHVPFYNLEDVAGLRIVVDGGLHEQDAVLERVRSCFRVQVVRERDRRSEPRYGYRAYHIILRVGDVLVEVQVRTKLQHAWAEASETLAELGGRDMRYGSPPTHPVPKVLAWVRTAHDGLIEEGLGGAEIEVAVAGLADLTANAKAVPWWRTWWLRIRLRRLRARLGRVQGSCVERLRRLRTMIAEVQVLGATIQKLESQIEREASP